MVSTWNKYKSRTIKSHEQQKQQQQQEARKKCAHVQMSVHMHVMVGVDEPKLIENQNARQKLWHMVDQCEWAALVMQYALTSSYFRVTDEPVPYIQVDLLVTDPQNHQNLSLCD